MHGQEWTNFFLGAQHSGAQIMSGLNQSVRSIEIQPKCTLDRDKTQMYVRSRYRKHCFFLPKKDLQLSF